MNSYNRKPKATLAICPKCGMDSGERKESVNLPIGSTTNSFWRG